MSDTLLDRFLRYVRIDTQSDGSSATYPSTPKQLDLLRLLRDELAGMGAEDVALTPYGYVLATIPATTGRRNVPTLAFLAHADTAPDFSGTGVRPVVHRNYDGAPIRFPDNPRLILDASAAPSLASYRGKDIVTASGNTLLGADDKAGLAVLMTLADHLLRHPKIPHGRLRLCFTPDEEIGRGVEKLDPGDLGASFAYTLDGGAPGEIGWQTFSADHATVVIEGVSTHPGEAKAKGMVNALHLAGKLLSALPRERCAPETTAGKEGYIHPVRASGSVEGATIELILRDFEMTGLAEKRTALKALCRGLQASEPKASITCRFRKQYRNMAYWLQKDMGPVEIARKAMEAVGLNITDEPVRGGTDGSRLTERGIPTPNLFCGTHNAHGPLEWVAVQDMELAVRMCTELVQIWALEMPGRKRKLDG